MPAEVSGTDPLDDDERASDPLPKPPRTVLGAAAGVGVALVAGLLLGEYAFGGPAVVGAAALIGLFVSEAAVAVGRGRSAALALAGAVSTVAGLLLAAWTATGRRFDALEVLGWLAFPVGAAAAALRAWPVRRAPRPGAGSPPVTEPEP